MDHVVEMLQNFATLPIMPYTDLTIQTIDSSIRIHTALLCSFSPLVSSMLSPLPTSSPHPFFPGLSKSSPRISVTNTSKSCLPLARDVLYTGYCVGTRDEIRQVQGLLGVLGVEQQFVVEEMLFPVASDTLELVRNDGDGDNTEVEDNLNGEDGNEVNSNREQVAVQEYDDGEQDYSGVGDFEDNEQMPSFQEQEQLQSDIQEQLAISSIGVRKSSRPVNMKASLISKSSQEAAARNSFFCPHCHMKFVRLKEKELHSLLEHSYEQPYLCQECGARFKIREDVEQHLLQHGGGRFQIQCEVCDQVCKTIGNYHKHYKVHSGLKEFGCCKCGKSFSTFSNLRKHEKLHEPKKLSCDVCWKKFHRKDNLKIHKNNHHMK